MDSIDNKKPETTSGSAPENKASNPPDGQQDDAVIGPSSSEERPPEKVSDEPAPYSDSYYDEYGYEQSQEIAPAAPPLPAPATPAPVARAATPGAPAPPAKPPADDLDDDGGDEGMLRMSFLEHLEELRSRILKALLGIGIAFGLSLIFTSELWLIIQAPAEAALKALGLKNTKLVVTNPTEAFSIIWVKLPVLTAIFLSSPWILFQVWSFIAPGLYKKERRWAAPFIICSAGLFIAGGLFGYFVAFRFGLTFLLGIAVSNNVDAMLTITDYFDTFVNVTLALGLVFELPVLIFFLALIRLVSPQFLIRNSRYAILIIVVLAAIVTPTPDVINLMLISVPMAVLYFIGVFATYLLWLSRENKRFPWGVLVLILLVLSALVGSSLWVAVNYYGYRIERVWPYLVR
jgi:sec-independent protein translocase protein TatC